MSNVMLATCRSYSAESFDGCPACVDSALDAVVQASAYLLGRSGPGFAPQCGRPVEIASILAVTLRDDDGGEIGSDEVEVDQTISEVQVAEADDASGPGDEFEGQESSMRLEDFQTVIDKLELATDGVGNSSGVIVGRLYAYNLSIGPFEVMVAPQA